MELVEIEDCKRCLLKGELVRSVKDGRFGVQIQIRERDMKYHTLQTRIIGKCAVTHENIKEIVAKFAELAEKYPSMGWDKELKNYDKISSKYPIKVCEMCGNKFRRTDGANLDICNECEKQLQEER